MRRAAVLGLLAWAAGAHATPASQPGPPAPAAYALVVGASRPPAQGLAPLRFADDDALRYAALFRAAGTRTQVLTSVDAETRDAWGTPPAVDGPPTWPAVLRAAETIVAAAARDRAAGRRVAFTLVFAGHGGVDAEGGYLALHGATGGVERVREAAILALVRRVPAQVAHLIVDACGAGDVFGVRDGGGHDRGGVYRDDRVARVQPRLILGGPTPLPPHVGLVLSSAAGQRAFEWQEIEAGVFSHIVLSALSGAADVDGDGAVSYRELDAFVRAAVRRVPGRARPRARVVAPRRGHAPVLRWTAAGAALRLVVDSGAPRRFSVEDSLGDRIADVHVEAGFRVTIHVPVTRPAAPLYIHAGGREATVGAVPGLTVRLAELAFVAPRGGHRGAFAEALRAGLFAEPFGPHFVNDVYPGLAAVVIELPRSRDPSPRPTWKRWWFWATVVGVAAASISTGAYFGTRGHTPGSELGVLNGGR